MEMPTLTGGMFAAKGFLDLMAPDVNYDVLNMSANQRELEGSNMELQVEQEANRLREEFIDAQGNAEYSAARRGVKVGEGNIQENIEMSAGDLGKDIQTQKENVKYKKGQLDTQAKNTRKAAADQRGLSDIGKVTGAIGDFGKAADTWDTFGSQKDKPKAKKLLGPRKKKKQSSYDIYNETKGRSY